MSDTDNGDAYQFEFVSLDGEKLPLAAWRGRPVLVVNTASFCGYTPQYRDLEALGRRDPRRSRHAALELSQIPDRSRRPARRRLANPGAPERPGDHQRNRERA